MRSPFDAATGPRPTFYFNNAGKWDLGRPFVAHFTAPAFAYGRAAPPIGAAAGAGAGGYLAIVAAGAIAARASAVVGGAALDGAKNELMLPRDANVFTLALPGGSDVRRLNNRAASAAVAGRFLPGTVVTLLFEEAGVTVHSSGYIELASATGSSFSSTAGATLTLLARPHGVWRELWNQR